MAKARRCQAVLEADCEGFAGSCGLLLALAGSCGFLRALVLTLRSVLPHPALDPVHSELNEEPTDLIRTDQIRYSRIQIVPYF